MLGSVLSHLDIATTLWDHAQFTDREADPETLGYQPKVTQLEKGTPRVLNQVLQLQNPLPNYCLSTLFSWGFVGIARTTVLSMPSENL